MKEETVERIYKRILKEVVEPITGGGLTYSNTLQKTCDRLGVPILGVYASDELPGHDGYYICNVDKSYESGSHWLGCVNSDGTTYIYDSFGRASGPLLSSDRCIVDSDLKDREQDPKQENCGARCIAWLLCVKHLGLHNALKI